MILITVVSAVLASRSIFLGTFGDVEFFLWHTDNFRDVITHGDLTINRAFFGEPVPYAYHRMVWLEVIPTLAMLEISGSAFFTYNFVLLDFLILDFCSMYLVLRLLGFRVLMSFVFALVYLGAPVALVHAQAGHLMFTVTFLLPPYFYFLYRIKRRPEKLVSWLALGIICGAYIWVSEELGLFVVLVSFFALLLNVRAFVHRRLMLHAAVWLGSVALFALPVLGVHIHRINYDREHGMQTRRGVQEAQLYSASPANYLFPSDESFFFRHLPLVFEHSNKVEHLNYLGIVNLVGFGAWLFMLALRRDLLEQLARRAPFLSYMRWELTVITVVSVTLSLGPILNLNGSTLKLPVYYAYDWGVPVVDQLRAWGRFGIFSFAVATFLSVHVFSLALTRRHATARSALQLLAVPSSLASS